MVGNGFATSALARMSMILHDNATAAIWKGNTISDPHWRDGDGKLKTFDFAVANPPFPIRVGPTVSTRAKTSLIVLNGVQAETTPSFCTSSKASKVLVEGQ